MAMVSMSNVCGQKKKCNETNSHMHGKRSMDFNWYICITLRSIDSLFESTTNQETHSTAWQGKTKQYESVQHKTWFDHTESHSTILKLIDTNRNKNRVLWIGRCVHALVLYSLENYTKYY